MSPDEAILVCALLALLGDRRDQLRTQSMTELPKYPPSPHPIEALMPPEMALACEAARASKARRDALALIVLGLLARAVFARSAMKRA